MKYNVGGLLRLTAFLLLVAPAILFPDWFKPISESPTYYAIGGIFMGMILMFYIYKYFIDRHPE